MKIEYVNSTVKELINWKKNQFLKVNHEYQRAPVWTDIQKKMFIDSIFRGYAVPAFYFHSRERVVGKLRSHTLEIIDGQQRIDAIYEYFEGAYSLLNPHEDVKFKFPNFVREKACPWGNKRFKDINDGLKNRFLKQKIIVFQIETDDGNEIRDLFIRLQGGTPLTQQEKRDSWPGNFTEYVLELGGKHGVNKYPGHKFFTKVAKPSGGESNKRKLAAQITMLYYHRRENSRAFCDIKSRSVDEFYHRKIGFDPLDQDAKRFEKILEKLTSILTQANIPLKGKGHYAIHLVLLLDGLLDEYVSGWEEKLPQAFINFQKKFLAVSKAAWIQLASAISPS